MAGRVGRPSIPSKVHFLHGNPSKKPLTALLDEFSPDASLPKAPIWVKAEARAEYKRLGSELERYRVISELDRGILVQCACEWARIVWIEKKITAANEADEEHGEAGFVARTPNNFRVMSVEIQLLRQAQAMYLKMLGELGCTPASRSRVKPSDGGQLSLPGIAQPDPNDERPRLASFA